MRNNFEGRFIKLVYWNEKDNLGDLLSPYIVQALSGKEIIHKSAFMSIRGILVHIYRYIKNWNIKGLKELLYPYEKNLLAIGSIIAWGNTQSLIWGSGFMREEENFRGGRIFAVRGKYTNDKLKRMGYAGTQVLGDPALLLPLCFNPIVNPQSLIGVIPHWSEIEYFVDKYSSKYKVIDLRTKDVEGKIREILSCKYILSTSLHGIIISHAYGIPALWIKHNSLHGDDFKFKDYFSSVGIGIYSGFTNIDDILLSSESCLNLFAENRSKTLPQFSLKNLQKQLLESAPFPIDKKYIS